MNVSIGYDTRTALDNQDIVQADSIFVHDDVFVCVNSLVTSEA